MSDWDIPPQPKIRIGRTTATLMLTVAFTFDALQLVPKFFYMLASAGSLLVGWIPFIGQATALGMMGAAVVIDYVFSVIIIFCGYMTLWLWFSMAGVPLTKADRMLTRRLQTFVACFLIESVPFLNILPTLTLFTFITIRLARKEDMARRREWHQRLERLIAQVRSMGVDTRRIEAFLQSAKNGGISHDKLTREVRMTRQRLALLRQERIAAALESANAEERTTDHAYQ